MNLGRQFTFTVPRYLTQIFLSDSVLMRFVMPLKTNSMASWMISLISSTVLSSSSHDDIATRTQGTLQVAKKQRFFEGTVWHFYY
jgi:hypothetical protein